jgi:hypothetical protein
VPDIRQNAFDEKPEHRNNDHYSAIEGIRVGPLRGGRTEPTCLQAAGGSKSAGLADGQERSSQIPKHAFAEICNPEYEMHY